MANVASAESAPQDSDAAAPADSVVIEQQPLIEEDVLVEDVSIDGMCGVY